MSDADISHSDYCCFFFCQATNPKNARGRVGGSKKKHGRDGLEILGHSSLEVSLSV